MKWLSKYYVINSNTGCWDWQYCTDYDGYGKLKVCQVSWYAHRYFYQIYRDVIPPGLLVCHTCDNPSCVNPEHLFLGTDKDNAQDKKRKGRAVKDLRYLAINSLWDLGLSANQISNFTGCPLTHVYRYR